MCVVVVVVATWGCHSPNANEQERMERSESYSVTGFAVTYLGTIQKQSARRCSGLLWCSSERAKRETEEEEEEEEEEDEEEEARQR